MVVVVVVVVDEYHWQRIDAAVAIASFGRC